MLLFCIIITCVSCKTTPDVETREEYHEAVVVGSGYGGAVAALRLGEANIETVVFEKGRRWVITDTSGANNTFASSSDVLSDSRSQWLNAGCEGVFNFCIENTGIVEITGVKANSIDLSPKFKSSQTRIMSGVGVGGGSLINNGETFPPTRQMWDMAYDLDAMPYMEGIWNSLSTIYFDKALSVLKPEIIPQDILDSDYYSNFREHISKMEEAGYPMMTGSQGYDSSMQSSHTPVIVDWDIVREEMSGKRVHSIIAGEVWLGINSGAKKSLDKEYSYLGLAEATGFVEVRALHTVTDIRYEAATKLYVVSVMETDLDYTPLTSLTIKTPNLIMGAGSVGTTKLMMKAKFENGLPNLNHHVGTKWSNNGNSGAFRSKESNPDSRGLGGPASIKSFYFENPDALVNIQMLPIRTPVVAEWVGMDLFTIALGIPESEGYFEYDTETQTVQLNWPQEASRNVYDRFLEIVATINFGGFNFSMPAGLGQGVTLHPLGGMPIGLATDEFCEVKGYEGLFVVDGAIIPGPSLSNPSLLIAAMAERCMVTAVSKIIEAKQ